MRFTTILAATAFGGFAAASEQIQIQDLTIREVKSIQAASLKIQPANVECASTSADELAGNKVVTCGKPVLPLFLRGCLLTFWN